MFYQITLTLGASVLTAIVASGTVPQTDLILYGRVFDQNGDQIVGSLPGPVTVTIARFGIETTDPLITSTRELVSATPGGVADIYVLRIPRFGTGAARTTPQSYVVPGDRLHIFLNGLEVTETRNDTVQLLVTDAVQDLRLLSLNGPTNPDSDGDGLPDNWERDYFGGLGQGPNDDRNRDQVNNFVAFALGLDPNAENSSALPFLRIEQGGILAYYFRQSSQASGLTYRVVWANSLDAASPWTPLAAAMPQEVGLVGSSRLMRVVIPEGLDRPHRFFRLDINR